MASLLAVSQSLSATDCNSTKCGKVHGKWIMEGIVTNMLFTAVLRWMRWLLASERCLLVTYKASAGWMMKPGKLQRRRWVSFRFFGTVMTASKLLQQSFHFAQPDLCVWLSTFPLSLLVMSSKTKASCVNIDLEVICRLRGYTISANVIQKN